MRKHAFSAMDLTLNLSLAILFVYLLFIILTNDAVKYMELHCAGYRLRYSGRFSKMNTYRVCI